MRRFQRYGFTLVEIAVVLFILALLTAGGLGLTSSLRTAANQKASLQNAETVKVALQNYLSRNGRLPCPAIAANTPTDATFGLEAPSVAPGDCTGASNAGPGAPSVAVAGVLPWKTLGLSFDYAIDGWGNQYTYVVTRAATALTTQTISGMRGSLTVHADAPVVNNLPSSAPPGNQINACNTNNVQGCEAWAVAVLISHGANQLGARTREGVATPAATSTREIENNNNDVAFVSRDISSGVNEFDDIVVSLSPNDLMSNLYGQGMKDEQMAMAEKRRQIVTGLAALSAKDRTTSPSISYPIPPPVSSAAPLDGTVAYTFTGPSAVFTGCSSPPTVPSTVRALPTSLQTMRDVWGRQFGYQTTESTLPAGAACVTPIIVVSAGVDGTFGNADDIVYYVPGPEFTAALSTW